MIQARVGVQRNQQAAVLGVGGMLLGVAALWSSTLVAVPDPSVLAVHARFMRRNFDATAREPLVDSGRLFEAASRPMRDSVSVSESVSITESSRHGGFETGFHRPSISREYAPGRGNGYRAASTGFSGGRNSMPSGASSASLGEASAPAFSRWPAAGSRSRSAAAQAEQKFQPSEPVGGLPAGGASNSGLSAREPARFKQGLGAAPMLHNRLSGDLPKTIASQGGAAYGSLSRSGADARPSASQSFNGGVLGGRRVEAQGEQERQEPASDESTPAVSKAVEAAAGSGSDIVEIAMDFIKHPNAHRNPNTGDYNWDGWCLGFVNQVVLDARGYRDPQLRQSDARGAYYAMRSAGRLQTDMSRMPAGAIVFWPSAANGLGHVSIFTGRRDGDGDPIYITSTGLNGITGIRVMTQKAQGAGEPAGWATAINPN